MQTLALVLESDPRRTGAGRDPGHRRCRRARARSPSSGSPRPAGGQLEADAPPGAAALEHDQVAAIGIDVHEVGIQRAHAQRGGEPVASAGQAQKHHHGASPRARRWPRSMRVPRQLSPASRALAPQARGAHAREHDDVVGVRSMAAGGAVRTHAALALDTDARVADQDARSLRGWRIASRRAELSRGTGPRPSRSESNGSSSVTIAAGEQRRQGADAVCLAQELCAIRGRRPAAGSSASARGTGRSLGARARSCARPRGRSQAMRRPRARRRAASSSRSLSSAVTRWPARARSSATRPLPAPMSRIAAEASRSRASSASSRHSGRSARYSPHSSSCQMTAGGARRAVCGCRHDHALRASPRATSSSRRASIAV